MFTRMSRALVVAVLTCGWAMAQQAAPAAKPDAGKDIVQTAMDAKLNTLVDLIKAAGLADTLKGPGPFTVFAPTDEAFAKLGNIEDMKKDKEKLAGILKAHVVSGKMMAADVTKSPTVKTLNGELKVTAKDGKVMLNDKVNVTKADIAASNGVVHLVDAVIMPMPAAPKAEAKPAAAAKPADAKPADAKPAEKKEEKKH